MKTDPNGSYVDYIEHARLVAKLEAERDRLRELLEWLRVYATDEGKRRIYASLRGGDDAE